MISAWVNKTNYNGTQCLESLNIGLSNYNSSTGDIAKLGHWHEQCLAACAWSILITVVAELVKSC